MNAFKFNNVKRAFLLPICFIVTFSSFSQDFKPNSLSLGYFGPLPFEYGFRAGLDFKIKDYDKSSIILSPHLGTFGKKNDNFNVLAGAEIGLLLHKDGSKNRSFFSLGSAYLTQFEVTEFTVNLQGKIISRERERRGIFMPTLNYQYARIVNDKWAPFVKLSYGYKIASVIENAGSFMWEFGILISLKNKQDG